MFPCKNFLVCRELMFVTLVGSNSLLCVKLVPKDNFFFSCTFKKCLFFYLKCSKIDSINLFMSSVLKPMLVKGN